ncbi:MAG: 1-acyl-sn-glycerol-3-phosphate acyltransferase [Thermoanaerobaculia bacterium]
MRSYLVFNLLLAIKVVTRLFYRVDFRWIGSPPRDRWKRIRLVALLNHTSLFEPLFAAGTPNSFLWRIAHHGVVPAAEKTIGRPFVGKLFRFVAHHVVSITRERDHTWAAVLQKIERNSMVIILPEGRMMRRGGLDSHGNPMTVRGGIADILEAMKEGRMLLAYSGGLHHVQAPGEKRVGVFKTIRMNLELVDIAEYRAALNADSSSEEDFKRAVRNDLERRRDLNCPADEESTSRAATA